MNPALNQRTGLWSALPGWAGSIAWFWIWVGAIGLALMVHLAFLVNWPDHFIHEDSAAYIIQAEAILKGHYLEDTMKRPYGVAAFLVLLSKLFGPHILVFVIVQHLISIGTALFVAGIVRFAGAPRVFALLAFCLAALHGRIVHYDNTIGAETISNFLVSLAAFIAAGAVFRKWPVWPAAAAVGLTLGAVMTCRSATLGQAAIILLWLAVVLDGGLLRRIGVLALAGVLATAVYLTPVAINAVIGKRPAGNELLAVMAFVVGYSGDFEHGVHLDRKAQARPFVEQMRAADTPQGWPDVEIYQWPFGAMHRLAKAGDSEGDLERVTRDIFVETLTTPSTLYRHLTRHFLREMYFLLFDANPAARRTPNPQGYEYFMDRDRFPFFGSPTGLKPGQLIRDDYKPWWPLSRLLSADRLQLTLNRVFARGYAPNSELVSLCCGLLVSTEYDDIPGMIRWLSSATLCLALVLLIGVPAGRAGFVRRPSGGLVAGGALMIMLALISAAFPTFLVYGLNRYAYYAIPFLAGASAMLGGVLFDWLRAKIGRVGGEA